MTTCFCEHLQGSYAHVDVCTNERERQSMCVYVYLNTCVKYLNMYVCVCGVCTLKRYFKVTPTIALLYELYECCRLEGGPLENLVQHRPNNKHAAYTNSIAS